MLEANKAAVEGVLDYLKIVLDWLGSQDLPALAAYAQELWDVCTKALADGRLDWIEIATISMKLISLLGKLKLAGFKV